MSLGASVSHTGMLRGCSFLQGPGGARPGSEWKWGHFLADAPLPAGCRARAPTRTFGQLMAKAQPPPSLCTISTLGEWKAMRGSPEAGSDVSFHIPPFAPNRVQVPYGEQLLYLSPHSMPQTGNNSNCKTRKHLLCPQPSRGIASHLTITTFKMGGIITPISQMRKQGLASRRPRQDIRAGEEHSGVGCGCVPLLRAMAAVWQPLSHSFRS